MFLNILNGLFDTHNKIVTSQKDNIRVKIVVGMLEIKICKSMFCIPVTKADIMTSTEHNNNGKLNKDN